ncbi:hypothetical protein DFQ30_011161 [Apophysomyces sp. BC1015]|nr:hypothetical protein DFQ30_011161 [Apophysomyces sp. BC1015]KAG0181126.1 hypothetical protein DFQ29_009285 [Apophysomyces sp. BC1021]
MFRRPSYDPDVVISRKPKLSRKSSRASINVADLAVKRTSTGASAVRDMDTSAIPTICHENTCLSAYVGVQEIKNDGLKAMLQSKLPLGFYLYHLLEEYCSENLFFFLEVEQYEACPFSNSDDQLDAAQRIYAAFLTRNCPLEVNLDDRTHRAIFKSLQASIALDNVFEAAKRHVFGLLSISYYRFLSSPLWDFMVASCDDLSTKYSVDQTRLAVVNLLTSHLQQQEERGYGCALGLGRSSREAIRTMVLAFCATWLDYRHDRFDQFRLQKPLPRQRSKSVDAKKTMMI